jgi:GNAT superfamily N-acetyltransferase
VNFRVAQPADVEALLAMQKVFYTSTGYPWDGGVMRRAFLELLRDPGLGRVLLVEGDAPLGYLVLAFGFSLEFGGRDAFVDELFVIAEERGRGFGTALLRRAEELAAGSGIRALHLEVEFTNESARELYLRSGYEAHSRQLMTRRLRGSPEFPESSGAGT